MYNFSRKRISLCSIYFNKQCVPKKKQIRFAFYYNFITLRSLTKKYQKHKRIAKGNKGKQITKKGNKMRRLAQSIAKGNIGQKNNEW